MLRKYSFKNYLSFMDETIVSLESSQEDEFVVQDFDGKFISLATSIIGPNASGKTTLLKPLALFEWLLKESFYYSENLRIPVDTHFFSEDKTSEFMYEFSFEAELYRYELTILDGYITSEQLHKKGKTRFEYLIKRAWDPLSDAFIVNAKDKFLENLPPFRFRRNASFLAILPQIGLKLFNNINSMIESTNLKVGSFEGIAKLINFPHFSRDVVARKLYENEVLRENIDKITQNLDLGVSNLIIKEQVETNTEGESTKKHSIFVNHRNGLKSFEMPLARESSGTQSLMILLSKIFPVFEQGGIVVVDEIEADLHPLMVKYLLGLFSNSEFNPKHAQIIFTTHSIEIINLLEKSQIFLTEKNECFSESWRLDQIAGVRRDDNYYAKYMAGAYGAIPRI